MRLTEHFCCCKQFAKIVHCGELRIERLLEQFRRPFSFQIPFRKQVGEIVGKDLVAAGRIAVASGIGPRGDRAQSGFAGNSSWSFLLTEMLFTPRVRLSQTHHRLARLPIHLDASEHASTTVTKEKPKALWQQKQEPLRSPTSRA
jgi:hypothetical protein